MSEWRPLSTAPRDGRRILVWAEDSPGGFRSRHVFIAKCYSKQFAKKGIWFDMADTSLSASIDRPGGWMPLPEPPNTEPHHD